MIRQVRSQSGRGSIFLNHLQSLAFNKNDKQPIYFLAHSLPIAFVEVLMDINGLGRRNAFSLECRIASAIQQILGENTEGCLLLRTSNQFRANTYKILINKSSP